MTRHLLPLLFNGFTFCLITSACSTGNKSNLRLALTPQGEKNYTFSLLRTSSISYRQRLSSDTFTLEGKFNLEQHEDSLVRMRFFFTNLQTRSNAGKSAWIDSMPDGSRRVTFFNAAEERDRLLALLPGMSISVILSRNGEVQQVDELDKITDSVSAIAQLEVSSVRLWLRDYLSGDAFKDIFNSVLYLLPGKEVAPSDKWTSDFMLTTKAPVKVSSLYTLESGNNDTATVRIQALLSATQGEGGRVYMKGKQDGYATVSRESGLPYYRETTSEFTTTTGNYDEVRQQELIIYTKEKSTLNIIPLVKG